MPNLTPAPTPLFPTHNDHPRSASWPEVRHAWLMFHDYCAFCGAAVSLEVHHIRPFHLHPELELEPTNFVTLCEGAPQCHLHVGHLGNWDSFNPALIADAELRQVVGSVAWRAAQLAPAPVPNPLAQPQPNPAPA